MDETLLTGIEAVLVDTTTSQEIAKEITNNKGEYVFSRDTRWKLCSSI